MDSGNWTVKCSDSGGVGGGRATRMRGCQAYVLGAMGTVGKGGRKGSAGDWWITLLAPEEVSSDRYRDVRARLIPFRRVDRVDKYRLASPRRYGAVSERCP